MQKGYLNWSNKIMLEKYIKVLFAHQIIWILSIVLISSKHMNIISLPDNYFDYLLQLCQSYSSNGMSKGSTCSVLQYLNDSY